MDEKNLSVRNSPRKRKRSVTPVIIQPKTFANLDEMLQYAKEDFNENLQNPERLREYEDCRQNLIKTEADILWDAGARRNASPIEKLAATIVFQLREHERENHFGNKASESIPGPETRDMGGQFLTNKERIESSKLYKISQQLPKGCHLHLHFNAELQPEILIEQAREMDTMFVRSTLPLISNDDYEITEIVFDVLPVDTPQADPFSATYDPDFRSPGCRPWMQWKLFRKEFLRRRNGQDPEGWIRSKMILSVEEVYGMDQTVNG